MPQVKDFDTKRGRPLSPMGLRQRRQRVNQVPTHNANQGVDCNFVGFGKNDVPNFGQYFLFYL